MNHQYSTSHPASYLHFYNNSTYSALYIIESTHSIMPRPLGYAACYQRDARTKSNIRNWDLSVSVKKLSDLDGDEEQAFNRYSDEEAWQV